MGDHWARLLTYRVPKLFGVKSWWESKEDEFRSGAQGELTSWYIRKGITVSCGKVTTSGTKELGRMTVVAYGHLREVSSKDTCDVMRSEDFFLPVEVFTILSV